MTGGLQEQVTDGKEWFGVGIEPTAKAIIGSQDVPWIYEDRIKREDFLVAIKKIFFMSKEERGSLGALGRKHVVNNYSMSQYSGLWYRTLKSTAEEFGSWENRRKHESWDLIEIK